MEYDDAKQLCQQYYRELIKLLAEGAMQICRYNLNVMNLPAEA